MTIHGFWLILTPFLSTLHYIGNSSPCMCKGWTKISVSQKRQNVIVCTDVCSMNKCERMRQGWITVLVLVAPSLVVFTLPSRWQHGLSKPTAHLFLLFTGPADIYRKWLFCCPLAVSPTTALSSFSHPSL